MQPARFNKYRKIKWKTRQISEWVWNKVAGFLGLTGHKVSNTHIMLFRSRSNHCSATINVLSVLQRQCTQKLNEKWHGLSLIYPPKKRHLARSSLECPTALASRHKPFGRRIKLLAAYHPDSDKDSQLRLFYPMKLCLLGALWVFRGSLNVASNDISSSNGKDSSWQMMDPRENSITDKWKFESFSLETDSNLTLRLRCCFIGHGGEYLLNIPANRITQGLGCFGLLHFWFSESPWYFTSYHWNSFKLEESASHVSIYLRTTLNMTEPVEGTWHRRLNCQ